MVKVMQLTLINSSSRPSAHTAHCTVTENIKADTFNIGNLFHNLEGCVGQTSDLHDFPGADFIFFGNGKSRIGLSPSSSSTSSIVAPVASPSQHFFLRVSICEVQSKYLLTCQLYLNQPVNYASHYTSQRHPQSSELTGTA